MTDESFWGADFSGFEVVSIHEIFTKQGALLPKLTNDYVSAELVKVDKDPFINNAFVYRFYLVGKYLNNYRFSVCTFSHAIEIYPFKIRFDEQIVNELKIEPLVTVSSSEEATLLTKKALSSQRIRSVISGIIKLSDSESGIPF